MPKFIFVCFQHGAGGEALSVEIRKLKKCNTLNYTKHGPRTWSYDYFDRLFLKYPSKESFLFLVGIFPFLSILLFPLIFLN